MDSSGREESTLEQLKAIVRYEILWNIRKKKVIAMVLVAFGIASLSLFLPVLLEGSDPTPGYFVDNLLNPPDLVLVILAIAISMNTISGEFEDGTIEPLASKPISRGRIYLGKIIAMIILLVGIYSLLEVYTLAGSRILYGPQSGVNLSVAAAPFLLTLSTLVWISISMIFGSLTKSSVAAAIGTVGIFFAISIGAGLVVAFAPESGGVINYLPGNGEAGNVTENYYPNLSDDGLSIQTGTNALSRQFLLYSHDGSAEVIVTEERFNFEGIETGESPFEEIGYHSYTMSEVFWRALLVSFAYIVGLGLVGWYGFKRSDISLV
ncbi:MAG: ABC transporter permease [Candidatus Hadarchaeota archaeon]